MDETFSNISSSPISTAGRILIKNKSARKIALFLLILFFVISIGIFLYATFWVEDTNQRYYLQNKIFPLSTLPVAIIFLIFLSGWKDVLISKVDIQVGKLREERKEITQKIENKKEIDIFQTIQLSLNQLTEYYTINKSQASISFIFSSVAIIIGLLTIVSGIWLFYLGNQNIQLTVISGIAGILLEFIGGAYFFMYKKSLEQVNFFYGQLIKIQDTMLSINLANNIPNEEKKADIIEKIIESLLERSLK
jgi:hypothetical protein